MRNATLNRRLQSSARRKSSIPAGRDTVQIILSLMLMIFSVRVGNAQDFERTFGGSGDEIGFSVVQTTDGGYAVAGNTNSFGSGNYDAYLVKTTAAGDTQWTRTYDGESNEVIYSMKQTSDGGYILAGWTGPYDAHDVYIAKVSATGDLQWTKTYGGIQDDEANSVAQTSDGGYIVAGLSESFDEGAWGDVYVLKLNTSGDTVWTRTYGGIDVDIANSVATTTSGGYILAGYTQSFGGADNIYLIKITASGDIEWEYAYAGDVAYSVAQSADGGYIVAGWIDYADYDVYLIKTDAAGNTQWTKTYGGSDEDEASAVATTSDGGYIVAGYTDSFGAGDDDVYVLKLNSSGDTIWTRTFGGIDYDYAYSVAQTADGGYILAGYTESFGVSGEDIYLIKTDSLGFAEIEEKLMQKPRALSINVFPNPFNSSCVISVETQNLASLPTIAIYDLRGNVVGANGVRPIDEGRMPYAPTNRTFIWTPAQSIASGLYLVRATMEDGGTITKRIVYLK